MILTVETILKKNIISFQESNRIDTTNLKLIKEQMNSILNDIKVDTNYEELILNFSSISFIDSSGLSMIINLYKTISAGNKSLKIINANSTILEIFNITKLNTFIEINAIEEK